MDIEQDLRDLESQIAALTEELRPLQADHDALFKQVARFEADNKHKNLSRPPVPKRVVPDPDDDVPPLIHYSCFDEAIQAYFHDPEPAGPEAQLDTDLVLAEIDARARGSDHALHESILRCSGVTAFPIDENLYDSRDDALLGLRFDLLCHTTLRFLKPHYIILRQRHLHDKASLELTPWHIFRYTTPAYVPLDRLSLLLGDLDLFVQEVQLYLVHTQYKHDKMEQVAALTYADLPGTEKAESLATVDSATTTPTEEPPARKIVSNLDKDLECRAVSLRINGTVIDLTCGLSLVEHASCTLSLPNPLARIFISALLANAEFSVLRTRFIHVFAYMRDHRLL